MLNVPDTPAMETSRCSHSRRICAISSGAIDSGNVDNPTDEKLNWMQRRRCDVIAFNVTEHAARGEVLAKIPSCIDRAGVGTRYRFTLCFISAECTAASMTFCAAARS